MVQEAEPPSHVCVALFLLYGSRNDIRIRFATYQHIAIFSNISQMCVNPTNPSAWTHVLTLA